MTTVVNMRDFQLRETRAVLRTLKDLAIEGELVGIAVCYQTRDGREKVLCTGPFRRRGVASRAGFLIQMEDVAAHHQDGDSKLG